MRAECERPNEKLRKKGRIINFLFGERSEEEDLEGGGKRKRKKFSASQKGATGKDLSITSMILKA